MLQRPRTSEAVVGKTVEIKERPRVHMLRIPEHGAEPRRIQRAHPRASFIASEELIREWDELATRVQATPYLRPGWVEAWWLAFGKGELQIKTVRRKGRLAALLPVVDYHGALRSVSNYHSPRAGLLAEDLPAAIELAHALYKESPRRVSMTSLDPSGSSIKACRWAAEAAGYKTIARPYQRSPYLDISSSWEEYESGLSKNLRLNLRRAQARLARQGGLSIDVVSGPGAADGPLREMFATEAASWKGLRGTAIVSQANTRNFYTNVARWAAAKGMLRLFFLRAGLHPLAAYYALQDKGTCYLLKGGYDSAYRHYSPGKLLLHAVVEHCFAAHLSRIEFHGDADAYKFLWAQAVHEQKRFEAFLPTAAGNLRWATLAFIKPTAKQLLTHCGFGREFRE